MFVNENKPWLQPNLLAQDAYPLSFWVLWAFLMKSLARDTITYTVRHVKTDNIEAGKTSKTSSPSLN